jgi:hypothetical protein
MHRLIKPIFWTFLFLVMMLVIDQVLVQVPPIHPAHAAVSNFYQDFRNRLTDLAFGEKKSAPKSIEAVIAKQQKETAPKKAVRAGEQQAEATAAPQTHKAQRYIYSDGRGELHFADSLDDVPDEYRGLAQPMGK